MPWLLIAGMRETGEEYLCQLLDADARGHDPTPSPIVRVLATLRYPRQRAIMQPETAHEIPPLPAGLICRLPALRMPGPEELALEGRHAESLAAALSRALAEAGSEEEMEILRRHAAGIIRHTARTVDFTEWNWRRIQCGNAAGERTHAHG